MIYCTILLHELGHILTAKIFGRRIYSFGILPVGLSAAIEDGPEEKWARFLIYLSGPFVNILLSVILYLCHAGAFPGPVSNAARLIPRAQFDFLILINSGFAVFNLIPALPLDGSRILRDILADRVGLFIAGTIVRRLSIGFIALFSILGAIQVIRDNFNFSLLAISTYILFSLKNEERSVAIMNMRNILARRSRMLKKGIYPARDLIALKSARLGEVIKYLDFDRFHFIHVLDEEFKCIEIFTEQEVMDGMLKYSSDLTFEEWMGKL